MVLYSVIIQLHLFCIVWGNFLYVIKKIYTLAKQSECMCNLTDIFSFRFITVLVACCLIIRDSR